MLTQELKEFDNSLDSLRHFVSDLDSLLKAHSNAHFASALEDFMKAAPKETALPVLRRLTEIFDRPRQNGAGGREGGSRSNHPDGAFEQQSITFEIPVSDDVAAKSVDNLLRTLSRPMYQQKLVYRSSLFILTSSIEWFVSQILHKYFSMYPGTLNSKDKIFSLNELAQFDSIDDAKLHVINTRVESILRSSIEEWVDVFKRSLGLSMGYLQEDLPALVEVYQRRNVLMHNGGMVNSIYLSKVDPALRNGVKAGDVLNVTAPYLEHAIGSFQRDFLLIAAELWKKLRPEDAERADVLLDINYPHMVSGRWSIAESLSHFIMKDGKIPEIVRLMGQLNYWLSAKRQGKWTKVRDDVERADFSGKDHMCQLAHYSLLELNNRFFELLQVVLMSKRLTKQEIADWPIFEEMRQDPRYDEYRLAPAGKAHAQSDDAQRTP